MQKLEFDKQIVSSAHESIALSEQLERLGQLHEELSGLQQGNTDLNSIEQYKDDLVSKKLLRHKDFGVRALVACCISDIMRIYAPDAPFTEAELCEIFKLFLSQFRLLKDPDNGHFIQQTYLITRLLECRSIVLIADLPQSNKLIEELFQVFYEKGDGQFPAKLWKIIGALLTEVVSECDSLSMTVLRLIFNAFLTHESREVNTLKGLAVNKDPSFEFSLIICESAANRLGRHFSKFYSEILYGITNENEGIQSVFDPSFKTLTKLHKLTSYIWQYTPELVHSVIGFVYQELCSDNVPLRIAATQLVAEILSFESTINFVVMHKDTYQIWLSKVADISPKVRMQWVKSVPEILANRNDINEDIAKGLSKTLIDTDEYVRLQSIRSLAKIPTQTAWKKLRIVTIFKELVHLIRDKSKEVREECISYVCRFYDEMMKDKLYEKYQGNNGAKEFWEITNDIPMNIFNLYYINDANINFQVDSMIFDTLLNLNLDEKARMERLLAMLSRFDEKAMTSFFAFNKRQIQVSQAMNKLFEVGGDKLEKLIGWLSSTLPKQLDAHGIIHKFLELHDSRINHLIKVSINQETNYPTLRNSLQELTIRLQDGDLFRKRGLRFGSTFTRETFQEVIRILVFRAAPLIYNVSSIPFLLSNEPSSNISRLSNIKTQLVENISEINPSLFKNQITSLTAKVTVVANYSNDVDTHGKQDQLKTLFKIFKSIPNESEFEDEFLISKLEDFVIEGNILECKYAIKIISLIPDIEKRDKLMLSIKRRCLPLEFGKDSSDSLCNKLTILSQLLKLNYDLVKEDCNPITTFILKDVLASNEYFFNDSNVDDSLDWINDEDLLKKEHWPIAVKLLSLELLSNRMLAESKIDHDKEDNESLETMFHKILKLFLYFVSNGGEVINEQNETQFPTPAPYQRRIRCHAGLQILKLAKVAKFNRWIESKFIFKLINLVEDESFPVRLTFMNKLKHYTSNESISIKFIPLVFFMPFEPDIKFKTDTKIWINFAFQKETAQRGAIFERSLPRLIHCIAHHPDIEEHLSEDSSEEDFLTACSTAIDYVLFYLDTVLKPESISLLYYLTGRVKQYRDVLDESPKAIYVISELVQMILNELKKQKNMNLAVYPGKLNLPSDLYLPFESMELAQANTFDTFIKDQYAKNLAQRIKLKCNKLIHGSSTTIKQQRQKRQLINEYRTNTSPQKRKYQTAVGDSEDRSDDDVYPSPVKSNREPQRKSFRAKRSIDYNEAGEENEE